MIQMKKPLLPILLLAAMQLFALYPLCGSVAETANELISEWGKLNQQMVEPLF